MTGKSMTGSHSDIFVSTVSANIKRENHVISVVFYLLVLLQVLPVWGFRYFPSSDGPSHLLNSYIFLNYARIPVYQEVFTVQVPTAGNLAGHGLTIALMRLGIRPGTCEKLVISLCLIGLAVAFRYAVSGIRFAHPAAAFLVLPFLYNWPMQMGFWSFSLGVPFLLASLGLCFRYRGRWNSRTLTLLFLTAAAVYLCHPLSWAACGLAIALMTSAAECRAFLKDRDRKRAIAQTFLPLVVFVPFAIPNLSFASKNDLVIWDHIVSFRDWLWPLYTSEPVRLFAHDSAPGRLLFLFFVLTTVGNLIYRVKQRKLAYVDTVLIVAGVLLLMGLVSPGRIGEGTFIGVRILLFGFLLWALWLGVTLPVRALAAVAAIAAMLSLWLTASRLPSWRKANREMAEIVQFGRAIPPNSFVCEINLAAVTELVDPLEHALDLVEDRNIVDVRDYEAGRNAFWTRFKPGYYLDENYLALAALKNFEGALKRFEMRTGRSVDYLLLTNLKSSPRKSLEKLLPTLAGEYTLLNAHPPAAALFKRLN
jgi:hypothetical protein